MGMFDYITYKNNTYQTKDTPQQFLAQYEIRGDELWYNDTKYDWVEKDDALFGGHLVPIFQEWKFCDDFDGLMNFYGSATKDGKEYWENYRVLFMDGRIIKVQCDITPANGDHKSEEAITRSVHLAPKEGSVSRSRIKRAVSAVSSSKKEGK